VKETWGRKIVGYMREGLKRIIGFTKSEGGTLWAGDKKEKKKNRTKLKG